MRANEAFWIFLGYKTCSQRPFAKTRMLHQGREEIDIMSRALDFEAIQRFDLPVNGLFAGVCISDQLGDHGVIEHADLAAFHHAIVDSDAIHLQRRIVADEPPGRRKETPIWILGIDAVRSEEHTSELQSLMRISYAVFCLKKKKIIYHQCT